ncbi:MAG TPA: response regulator [Opitutaceae bacterium]|nr:response regulator [Opitutaceae bacterium]
MPAPVLPPILIVDDSATDSFLAKRLLEEARVPNPVFTFDDGQEAVEFLETMRRTPGSNLVPAVLFLDLKMVRMSGLDVIARIRRQSEFDGMRVIVFTSGGGDAELQAKADAAGADGFYAKFPGREVIARIVAGAAGAD